MKITLKPLVDQVIVITGASSGIGLVTAKTAAARGAKVLLVARSEDALADAVREIEAAGGIAAYKRADVGIAAEVEAAAAFAVERFGRIDTWVNDAGIAIYGKLIDVPDDEHRQLFQTNYFGVVHGARAAVPRLANGGALITVGSIAGDMASPIMGAYAASKHAVRAYVQALRIELHGDDLPISVTLVKPSGIDTPIAAHAANQTDGGKALIPPPVYDPQLVADAILDSAVNPRREITIGGVGRAQVLFSEHFPRVFEWMGSKMLKGFTNPEKPQPKPSNLFEPKRTGEERSDDQPGRKTSLYTAAALHPKTTTAAVGLVAALGAVAVLALRRKDAA